MAALTISGQGRDRRWELLRLSLLISHLTSGLSPGLQSLFHNGHGSRIPKHARRQVCFLLLPPIASRRRSELLNQAFKTLHHVNSLMQVPDEQFLAENLVQSKVFCPVNRVIEYERTLTL